MDRKTQIVEQLRAFMQRHQATGPDIQKKTGPKIGKGGPPAVSQVTVRRILKGEFATEPERETLTRIAEAYGETYQQAFGEAAAPAAPGGIVEVVRRGGRPRLKVTGDVSPQLEKMLQAIIDAFPEEKLSRIESLKDSEKK